ncbi:hypothetical protein [Streptomyces sp. FH025]|uniref:hypothetical protein n=1 Tax=Streptomyces sp. FH025 TaxID=2815937 RepID=UPI001A9E49F8|nr:hypothetical protein [Streptomyces sp. FH025]MBO1414043.1 hypothetical protein [Streptomyces sp. FH025]
MHAHDHSRTGHGEQADAAHRADRPSRPSRAGAPGPAVFLALQPVVGNAAVARRVRQARAGSGGPASPPVQRALKVGGEDLTKAAEQDPVTVVHEAFAKVSNVPVFDPELKTKINANSAAILKQLDKWILDDAGNLNTPPGRNPPSRPHQVFGTKRQDRAYEDYTDLARALVGWVEAKGERHRERETAEAVQDNPQIEVYLDSLLSKIFFQLDALSRTGGLHKNGTDVQAEIEKELRTGISTLNNGQLGHYQKYFAGLEQTNPRMPKSAIGFDLLGVLQRPRDYSFRDKIIALHDLMEYFGGPRKWIADRAGMELLPEPAPGTNLSTTSVNFDGSRATATTDRGQRPKLPSTRDENEESTKFARRNRIPVWAGASMTTVRMENLAQWAGASAPEREALGWGIFSFWRLDYDHTFELAYHTLHEVMDMVHNFGVDYNPLDRHRGLNAFTLPNLVADVTRTWQSIDRMLAELRGQLTDYQANNQQDPHYDHNVRAAQDAVTKVQDALTRSNDIWRTAEAASEDEQRAALRDSMHLLNSALSALEVLRRLKRPQ